MVKLNKNFCKVICSFFVALVSLTFVVSSPYMISSQAENEDATIVVALDKNTLNVGDTFNVKVTYESSLESGYLSWTLEYDNSLVSHGDSAGKIVETEWFDDESANTKSITKSYTFTAKAVGKVTFSIAATSYKLNPDDGGDDEMIIGVSGASATILDVGSDDANLKSLDVDGGTLVPAFSPDITEYTVNVPFDITALYVYPKTSDSRATHTIEGDEFLNVGTKTRTVVVTAQDGTVKKYVIKITRAAKPTVAPTVAPTERPETAVTTNPATELQTETPVETVQPTTAPEKNDIVTVNGQKYIVENIGEDTVLPEGFEQAEIAYKGNTYTGAKGISKKLNLLNLVSMDSNTSALFVYDADNNVFFKQVDINVKSGIYTFMRLLDGEKGLNLTKTQVTIGENTVDAYEIDPSEKEIFIIRAMNWNGAVGYYTYDTVENTMQRYTDVKFKSETANSANPIVSETPMPTKNMDSEPFFEEDDNSNTEEINSMLLILTISAGVVCLFMAAFLIYFALKERKTCKIMNEMSAEEQTEQD